MSGWWWWWWHAHTQKLKCINFSSEHFLLKGHSRLALPKKLLASTVMIQRRWSNSDLKTVVTPSEKYFSCINGCGRTYKLASSLTRHLNLECGKPKKFWCELCPKSYTRKESLKFHINEKHTDSANKSSTQFFWLAFKMNWGLLSVNHTPPAHPKTLWKKTNFILSGKQILPRKNVSKILPCFRKLKTSDEKKCY